MLKNYNESIIWFDKALAISPNSINALMNKGITNNILRVIKYIYIYFKLLLINHKLNYSK